MKVLIFQQDTRYGGRVELTVESSVLLEERVLSGLLDHVVNLGALLEDFDHLFALDFE